MELLTALMHTDYALMISCGGLIVASFHLLTRMANACIDWKMDRTIAKQRKG